MVTQVPCAGLTSLAEFGGSGMWALDLQLRGLGETKKQYRATLYVGTTNVLDLKLIGQSFALSASPTFATEANGWSPAWAKPHDAGWLSPRWAEVDDYLQAVIERVVQDGSYVKEGMVQAAIGRFPSTGFTVIDREAIVSFGSQPEKDARKSELAARWLGALYRPDPPRWWKTRPTRLGDECDVLAVSAEGEILAIEVKPHTASDKDIAWSVLQAGMYADLFQRWADYAGGKAHEVLHGMAAQRKRIGLSSGTGIQLAAPIKVRPVVALDRRAKGSAKEKLAEVRAHLAAAVLPLTSTCGRSTLSDAWIRWRDGTAQTPSRGSVAREGETSKVNEQERWRLLIYRHNGCSAVGHGHVE